MSGLRQAALVLHGLCDEDRAWLLGRLPEHRARELSDLVVELLTLGMPSDLELVHEAIHGRLSEGQAAAADKADHLMTASVDQLESLLRGEPDPLIALVMSSGTWSWREPLLMRLGPARAQRIRELTLSTSAGPRLRAAVLEELACRIGSTVQSGPHESAQVSPPRRTLHRFRSAVEQRWRAWRR